MPSPDITQFKSHNDKHARSQADIIHPLLDDEPGNPVLFDRVAFDQLTRLEGDQGGRTIFGKFNKQSVPWNDNSTQQDIDSPEDYQNIKTSKS